MFGEHVYLLGSFDVIDLGTRLITCLKLIQCNVQDVYSSSPTLYTHDILPPQWLYPLYTKSNYMLTQLVIVPRSPRNDSSSG